MQAEEGRVVVVAIDSSDVSENAFRWYLDNMAKEGDRVVGITVVEYNMSGFAVIKNAGPFADPEGMCKQFREQLEANDKLCHKYMSMLRDSPVKIKGNFTTEKMGKSKPWEVIVEEARKNNATAIVMGRRGLSKMQRVFMGSNSQNVLLHAPCAVTIVGLQGQD